MTCRVIHTAQALVDVVLEVPGLPPIGGNVMASSDNRYAAGAVNILLAAARSGATCVHAGSVGDGCNGDLVRSALAAEGVAVSSPVVQGEDTGICVVLLEPTAQRTFVTTQEAERRITVDSLATSTPRLGDIVCVSGYSFVGDTCEPLVSWLEALPEGIEVVLDPGAAFADLDPKLRDRVLDVTTLWTGNVEESQALTGEADMVLAAPLAAARVGGVAVVRDGGEGCAVHADGTTTVVPGFRQTPVDTNGAGDAHTGVLVACRALGMPWVEAVTRANAGAAIKVTRRGPGTAPTAAEIDAFLARS